MKKITALLLVVLMLAAMSIAVFARYEVCPECHGRMRESTKTELIGYVTCKQSGDSSMQDKVYREITTLRCSACGYQETETATYVECNH